MDIKLVVSGVAVFIAGSVLYFVKAISTESPLIVKLAFIGLIVLGIVVAVLGMGGDKSGVLVSEEHVVDEEEAEVPELEEPKADEAAETEAAPVEAKPEVKRAREDKSQIRETDELIREVARSMKKKGRR